MRRIYFTISIFILISLLSSCAGQPAGAKPLEDNQIPTIGPTEPAPNETTQTEVVSSAPPKDCPLTVPQNPPFTPPVPYDKLGFKDHFWYGSDSLWTVVPTNGVWRGLPYNPPTGLTQKIFWWRDGYSASGEPQPNLIVTGERLDASAPRLNASEATNAFASDIGEAMLVGVDFSTPGCWKITGKYKDTELSFVVWIAR
jgi:hypothetical protein